MIQETTVTNKYDEYASVIAPAAAGCAIGMLFGRGMRRSSSNIVALGLLAASAAIAAPVISDVVKKLANRPSSQRGSRKRLDGILNSSVPETLEEDFYSDHIPDSIMD
jgi:uncharacterized membrane protein YebE (DUF533 family)